MTVEGTSARSVDGWGDARPVAALRAGDEEAFAWLVDRYHGSLLRLALSYVRDRSAADDVVQDAWLGVIRGIDRFEGRSSVKTWIFRILINRAKSRGAAEARCVPRSTVGDDDSADTDPSWFESTDSAGAGRWSSAPQRWDVDPSEVVGSTETLAVVAGAVEMLPPMQRRVIVLRDVEGATSEEACALLALSPANQRVLLHRARTRVRAVLDAHLCNCAGDESTRGNSLSTMSSLRPDPDGAPSVLANSNDLVAV